MLRHKCILLLLCSVFSLQKCSSRHLSTKMSAPWKTDVGCYQDPPDKVFNDICQDVKVRVVQKKIMLFKGKRLLMRTEHDCVCLCVCALVGITE